MYLTKNNLVSELQCPAIPGWLGVEVNTTTTSIDTYINAACMNNMVTDADLMYQTSVCNGSGDWHPQILPCEKSAQSKKDFVVTESGSAINIGAVAVGVSLTLVVIIFITDIPTYLSELKKTFPRLQKFAVNRIGRRRYSRLNIGIKGYRMQNTHRTNTHTHNPRGHKPSGHNPHVRNFHGIKHVHFSRS